MAISTAAAIVGSAVIGAGSSLYASHKAEKAADAAAANTREVAEAQAREFLRSAEREREIAVFESTQIRRKALEQRGAQIAAAAANGVVVGDGTVAGQVAKTMRLAKQDILVTLYNAEKVAENLELKAEDAQKTGQVQASVYKAEGNAAAARGVSGAVTALSAAIPYIVKPTAGTP